MPLKLPPPPKSRGVLGLLVAIGFVIWTAYLMSTYATQKPVVAVAPVEKGPTFVEVDLRGAKFDAGRYEGFQKGQESKAKGLTMPTANVLAFQAGEAAKTQVTTAEETNDFMAGYQSGFTQAMKQSIK